MYEIGRLCVKTAGRDSRLKCVIVEVLEGYFVMIDGQTRRKKCNIKHLEPLDKVLKIKKNALHEEVVEALKKEGIEVAVKEVKEKKAKADRAVKNRKVKPAETTEKKEEKPKKTAAKKTKKE
jgi:large subunit ribosomal protein L14e